MPTPLQPPPFVFCSCLSGEGKKCSVHKKKKK
uniref:Uncharacterized protein n=1 Tax=viral metagenome TaxID=1070528 RepID=A0A6C0IUR7_9ZZZZ